MLPKIFSHVRCRYQRLLERTPLKGRRWVKGEDTNVLIIIQRVFSDWKRQRGKNRFRRYGNLLLLLYTYCITLKKSSEIIRIYHQKKNCVIDNSIISLKKEMSPHLRTINLSVTLFPWKQKRFPKKKYTTLFVVFWYLTLYRNFQRDKSMLIHSHIATPFDWTLRSILPVEGTWNQGLGKSGFTRFWK